MQKITRAANGEMVVKLTGRMGAENLAELQKLISAESDGRRSVLDLKDLKLVDQDAVSFLKRCEADPRNSRRNTGFPGRKHSIQLKNYPAYIREWIKGERQ